MKYLGTSFSSFSACKNLPGYITPLAVRHLHKDYGLSELHLIPISNQ